METARWPRRRWDLVASCVAVNLAAGCTYDYSVYSPVVKETYNLTQRETNLVMNFGFFIYALGSYGYGICNQHFGPQRSPRIGCGVMLFCYAILVLNLLQPVVPGVAGAVLMSLMIGIGWAGQATSLGCGYQRVCQVFPESGGIAIGILKTSLGAGGALAPAIFFGLWGQRPPENILGMKLFPAFASCTLAIAVISMTYAVDAQPGWSPKEGRTFSLLALAMVLITGTATANSFVPLGAASDALLAATVSLLLALFLALACVEDKQLPANEVSQDRSPMHIKVQQASKTLEFWMYTVVFSTAAGSGQLVFTNLSQMAEAIGCSSQSEALLCSFSFCNMLGRLSFGMACDILQHRRASRTLLFVASTLLATVGQLLLHAAALQENVVLLFVGVCCVGLQFGGAFPTLVNVCAARYGRATLNGNWTFMDAVGNGTASLVFGSYLGSFAYDRHAGSDHHCYGPNCFALSHLIMAVICACGTIISILLIYLHPRNRQIRHSLSSLSASRSIEEPMVSFDIDASTTAGHNSSASVGVSETL